MTSKKNTNYRLTQFSPGAGWACKLSPSDLAHVLGKIKGNLPKNTIGFDLSEDCAIYPLDDKKFTLQSLDFFTPIVDDPFTFGQIAAANSLSDIYAMGGQPLYALNIVEFPSDILPLEILYQIMKGGLDITNSANIPILGGHTIKDSVPKYGLVVTGQVNKEHLVLNSTAKNGDVLILTKPIGLGIISTAIKKNNAPPFMIDQATKIMTHLNRGAANAINAIGINACTDITGYGLLGHLLELCQASNVSSYIEFNSVPLIEGVYELVKNGFVPGGTKKNLEHVKPYVSFSKSIYQDQQYLLADAQTSGGLLISVAKEKATDLQNLLKENGCISSNIIGNIYDSSDFPIYIS